MNLRQPSPLKKHDHRHCVPVTSFFVPPTNTSPCVRVSELLFDARSPLSYSPKLTPCLVFVSEPFYDASWYELRQPPSAALRTFLRTIAHDMSQLLPSATLAAPGELRPPVIGGFSANASSVSRAEHGSVRSGELWSPVIGG